MSSSEAIVEDTATTDSVAGILALCALGLLGVLYATTLGGIADICWNQDDYSHGVLLPFISVYMLWENKKKVGETLSRGKPLAGAWLWAAIGTLAGGLLLYLVGQISGSLYATWLSFFPVVLASLFFIFGRAGAMWFVFPVALIVMAKPLPDALILKLFWPLQVLSAKVSTRVLEWLNVPVYVSGNVIEIPGMRLMVEEACSGMRSVMALLTVALIVIYFVELPKISKLAIVVMSVLLAVALNVLRVAATGVLAHFYDPQAATGFFHEFSGFIIFGIGLVLLYGFGRWLARFTKKEAI